MDEKKELKISFVTNRFQTTPQSPTSLTMSAAMASFQDKLDKFINQKGTVGDTFKVLEDNTGVKRIYIAYGIAGLLAIWLASGFGAQLLANIIGFAYPAYCSIKALESTLKSDCTQWLTYWVVFGSFSVVEFFADFIAGWVPFYWLSKCLFMVWCMAPMANNGSAIIYSKVILPWFHKHSTTIDRAIGKAGSKAGDIFDEAVDKAFDIAAEAQLNKDE